MKNIGITLFLVFLIFSCQKKEKNNENIEVNEIEKTVNDESLESLSEKIDGTWISDSYLRSIENNNSIYKSRDYDSKILGFNLDKNELQKGNAILEGFTDHEGGYSSPIVFDEKLNIFVNDLNNLPEYAFFSDEFQLEYNDDLLQMKFPKEKRTDSYRKLKTDFQTELRQIVTAGKYQSNEIKGEVVLDSNGKVQNFFDYKYYELVFDFTDGFEFDAIVFFKDSKGGNWADGTIYKFVKTKNELVLQKVQSDWETMEHTFDSKKIILQKK